MKILNDRQLDVAFLENVKGLGRPPKAKHPDGQKVSLTVHESNLSYCLIELSKVGFHPTATLLDPRSFGSPQSRLRYWISAVNQKILSPAVSAQSTHRAIHSLPALSPPAPVVAPLLFASPPFRGIALALQRTVGTSILHAACRQVAQRMFITRRSSCGPA
eukprot:5425018-Pyramimonas_sp.AAC.1